MRLCDMARQDLVRQSGHWPTWVEMELVRADRFTATERGDGQYRPGAVPRPHLSRFQLSCSRLSALAVTGGHGAAWGTREVSSGRYRRARYVESRARRLPERPSIARRSSNLWCLILFLDPSPLASTVEASGYGGGMLDLAVPTRW